eukprot:TRINITY_DN5951_c0_g1_i1.p2 TRINITY_DN5951_c0_g1~~TRINITY_DN5951_c0_g1_i1.p2  ORF type:complete len:469 (+),score=113.24 TRINITY_DN5951_c0_g1_i1:1451-2857(+)
MQFDVSIGCYVPNRIAKSALTESLADPRDNAPNEKHYQLYTRWGKTGAGIIMSGNVMIDRRYLENPANVVVDDDRHVEMLSRIAKDSQKHGSLMFVQLSHPGRQCPISICLTRQPVAPSDLPPVKIALPLFRSARALTLSEVEEIILAFGRSAEIIKRAGFHGVQIHSAHGYLISQFNSPLYNKRTDKYGGSPENNRRFLLEVYREVRKNVGPNFPISVKLNSADFQKGGLTEEDSLKIIEILEEEGLDLLEISGGSYESVQFIQKKESTQIREAYFLEFAKKVSQHVKKMPIMLTGGLRSTCTMHQVLKDHQVDVIGLGRPFCVEFQRISQIISPNYNPVKNPIVFNDADLSLGNGLRDFESGLQNFWHQEQIRRIAEGNLPDPEMKIWKSLIVCPVLAYVWSPRRSPVPMPIILIGSIVRSEEPRLNSSHANNSYAVFCLKKKNDNTRTKIRNDDRTRTHRTPDTL